MGKGVVSSGVLLASSARRMARAISSSLPCARMCRYIVFGVPPRMWLCNAVCSTPPACSAEMTGLISASVSTRSPIAVAWPSAIRLNATHDPSASDGFTWTSPTITCRSRRGKLNFMTLPGCGAPRRPSACSTPLHEAGAWARANDGVIASPRRSDAVNGWASVRRERWLIVFSRTAGSDARALRLAVLVDDRDENEHKRREAEHVVDDRVALRDRRP